MLNEIETVLEGLRVAYSKLTFRDFCEVIGEPETRGGNINTYAFSKWQAFREVCDGMSTLGTFLPKLIEWGIEEQGNGTT